MTITNAAFAARVRALLPRVGGAGRFGPRKVFICALWRAMAGAGRIDLFKQRLVDCNREGLLALARADLVGAMDPELVRESEIHWRGAEFHFVVDESIP